MPFNPSTNRLDALWNFVDQFQAGDDAARSDFDTALQDVRAGINDMAAYLEGLLNVDGLTDQRYLGRSATAPTLRANGDNLFIGDFYSTSDALGRTNLFYVWDGVAFVPASDFAAITPFFKNLAAVDNAATMRGLLELGTAAVQNATAFAPSSLTGTIGLFLSLAANGLAKTVTDWNSAHVAGPGCGFFGGDAAAIGGPAVLNTVAIYLAYDANSGVMIACTPSTKALYWRVRSAGVWDSGWTLFGQRNLVLAGASVDSVLNPVNAGVDFYRIGPSVSNLPAGVGEGDLLLSQAYDGSDAGQLIMTRSQRLFMRGQAAGITSPWKEALIDGPLVAVNYSGITLNNLLGTYSRVANTVTVTAAGHGHQVGHVVWLDFTSGLATDGEFVVASVTDANTFTVAHATSGTTSGTISLTRRLIRRSKNVQSVVGSTVGRSWVNFITPLLMTDYIIAGMTGSSNALAQFAAGVFIQGQQLNGMRLYTGTHSSNSSPVYVDIEFVNVVVFAI